LNEDFEDVLIAMLEAGARFLVVGAHALAVHGVPRATGDLDIWIDRSPENVPRVWAALLRFGAPVSALGISEADLSQPGTVVQIGLPPRRIDVLTDITGVEFAGAWPQRVAHQVAGRDVPFIGRAHLLANKRAAGRAKDQADAEALDPASRG
jgi:hypothetical protein